MFISYFKHMWKQLWAGVVLLGHLVCPASMAAGAAVGESKLVYVLPIREDIMPPLVYLVRRGVKEAMAAKADVLLIDMDTHGGRVDVTEEIMGILGQFRGETVTYVNTKAFSAGAFISVATQKIFMAPQSVIGAAAPIMVMPGGGPQEMPATVEAKTTSGLSALVRAQAEKNGHNKDVVQAMMDKTAELTIDGKVINKQGNILTLTNREAEEEYGEPPKPLLSLGTKESIDEVLGHLGYGGARVVRIEPLGAEKFAFWFETISPLILIVGIVCLYIEFKTPGFGIFGIAGISAVLLYFVGGYAAGLAGKEELALLMLLFVLGIALVALELFVMPGTLVLGLSGMGLMLVTLLLAMVDRYPGMPVVPSLDQLAVPVLRLFIAVAGAIIVAALLGRFLPQTRFYGAMVSQAASGVASVHEDELRQQSMIGRTGVAVTPLHPGGKGRFGEQILDVVTEGGRIEKGAAIRIIGNSGYASVVEPA